MAEMQKFIFAFIFNYLFLPASMAEIGRNGRNSPSPCLSGHAAELRGCSRQRKRSLKAASPQNLGDSFLICRAFSIMFSIRAQEQNENAGLSESRGGPTARCLP